MRFIIKKLKGETLMLELLPGVEEREKPGRKPAKITDMGTPIFKRIHARTMAAIDKSIEEANFRFHSKGLGENAPESVDEKSGKVTPAIKDGVYVTARASQCWKVHKANADSPGGYDEKKKGALGILGGVTTPFGGRRKIHPVSNIVEEGDEEEEEEETPQSPIENKTNASVRGQSSTTIHEGYKSLSDELTNFKTGLFLDKYFSEITKREKKGKHW